MNKTTPTKDNDIDNDVIDPFAIVVVVDVVVVGSGFVMGSITKHNRLYCNYHKN